MPANHIEEPQKASKLVYDFCAEKGICVLCKRHYAEDGRMCNKCRAVSKRAQKNFRNKKKEAGSK